MQSSRIFTVVFFAGAASLCAQLPPSALNPTRPPAQPVPVQPAPTRPATQPARLFPGVPGTPAPTTPGVPADSTEPAASPVADVDLSNAVPNTLTPEETAQGWKLLFDGKRLIGMRGVHKSDPIAAGWKIQDGELVIPKDVQQMDKITGGDIATVEQFWDFDFRFEWRATVSANSGVRYLVSSQVGQPVSGLEYQIIDDVHNPLGLKGGPIRRSSALDNILPPGPNAHLRTADPLNKKADPWNEGRIVMQGNKVEHWLNGEKVLEFSLGPQLRATYEKNYKREEIFATRPHALYGMRGKSPIVLVDQGTEVAFRNLKVRALAPQAVAPAVAPTAPGYGQRAAVPNPFNLPPRTTPPQPR